FVSLTLYTPPSPLCPYTTLFRSLDLLEEPRGPDDRRELRVHDLDGDFAIVARVVGEVYGGHAAGAQLALERVAVGHGFLEAMERDRKSTRLNSSHVSISYAVFCL